MKYIGIITNNWKIKFMTLLVASSMWFYAASIETNVAKFPSSIPIGVVNLTPGYVAIFDQKELEIEIAADATVWQKLSVSSFTAFIDLNGFSSGTYEIPINVTTQIADLSIISKNPNIIVVTIEPAVEKEVPVVAKVSGDAAENMVSGEITFDPANVKISGPESIVSGISQATAEIVLGGESQDFSKAVKLTALDNKNQPLENISFSPGSVIANIQIVRAGNVKNVGVKVVTVGLPANGFFVSSVSTDPAIISISGVPNVVRTISSVSTSVINISGANRTINTTASVSTPNGIRIDGGSNILVTIVISPIATQKPLSVPINFINMPAGLKIASVSSQFIDIVISGQANIIESTNVDDITLNVDLSGAKAAENSVLILSSNFSLPSGISISSISPTSITVNLN